MEISLDLVTEAARRRLAAVSPEVAAYIVLLATRELEARLFRVTPANLALSETGEVRAHPEGWMSEREVEGALRGLLASLLALSPSPAPSVAAVAERGETTGLQALTAELTAALIPINHAAARRALARLFRETLRARDAVVTDPSDGLSPRGKASLPPSVEPPTTFDDELHIDVDVESSGASAADPTRSRGQPSAVEPPSAPPPARETSAAKGGSETGASPAIAPPPSAELTESAEPEPLEPLEPQRFVADSTSAMALATAAGEALEPLEIDCATTDVRSDVDALIAAFLGHTRAESAMTRALRQLVGLERGPAIFHFEAAVPGVRVG